MHCADFENLVSFVFLFIFGGRSMYLQRKWGGSVLSPEGSGS